MDPERRTVLYSGTVQGVGFRWQTTRALSGVDVTGYVRNLPDGTVKLVVEGNPDSVSEAVESVATSLGHLIARQLETASPATGEFTEFAVRR